MADEDYQSTSSETASQKESKKKMYMWIAIIALIVIIVAGIAFVFGTNNAASNQIRGLIIKTQPTPTPIMEDDSMMDDEEDFIMEPTETPTPTDEIEPTEEPLPTQGPEISEEPEPTNPGDLTTP